MNLNCKAGDLAIVISEEAGCEANIGRCVRVQYTLRETQWGLMWHVIPEGGDPQWVCTDSKGKVHLLDTRKRRAFIPDVCLMPIGEADASPRSAPAAEQTTRLLNDLKKGAAV